jgi:hypothetical protein
MPSVDGHVFPTMGSSYFNVPSAGEQQRERIESHSGDAVFNALVRVPGPPTVMMRGHIYAAEKHGLFCFLTMDFALIRTVAAQAKGAPLRMFKTKVLTPEDLAHELDIASFPPRLYGYHDASFLVRSDLSMPTGKRRCLKDYQSPNR